MSLRPSDPNIITQDDLMAGDILLSCGPPLLDKLITMIDQGDYAHVSQYIGKENGEHMVVEATTKGILYHDTSKVIAAQNLIDAYRFVSRDGHRLGDSGWPVHPMIEEAKTYAGGNYAYSALILMAVVLLASDISKLKNLQEIIRLLGSELVAELVKWLESNREQTPMTCVQVATSCHWEANTDPAHKYALWVEISRDAQLNDEPDATVANSEQDIKKFLKMKNQVRDALRSAYPEDTFSELTSRPTSVGFPVEAGSAALPSGSTTPRDLQTSPTLEFIGCLKDTRY